MELRDPEGNVVELSSRIAPEPRYPVRAVIFDFDGTLVDTVYAHVFAWQLALAEAGIARPQVYVTNVVKHFKWEPRGKRRIHKKPNDTEIRACHPWLEEEIKVTKPSVIVVLGATAAQSLLGKQFRVTQQRGKPVKSDLANTVIATVHPSSVLRAPDDERAQARREFFADIRAVAKHIAKS